ncbi:MAG TPA: OmpH family outer membrane protein [Thermodesulfovibrionales bacterium]|nr:OmpH family outer membrane protein [Thermodesulfovibrionales bacterium]
MNGRRSVAFMAILFLMVMVSTALMTSSASGADGLKVGYVDLRVVLNECDAGKKARTELESLIKTKQSTIDEKGKTIEKMKSELDKQASALSPDARKSKEDEIERFVRDYQRLVQDSQNDVKKKENEVTGSILKEIREIVERIGKEDGYSLILENAEGIILYSRKDLDVSDKVIKNYNEWKAKQKK